MPAPHDQSDLRFMRRALRAAERGRGSTRPNPVVGAVIARNGRVIAVGHHARAGGPHAEIEALRRAGARARGSTMYVTLEPCCHTGRTGPCTKALIAAGVARVVVACRDPNPLVNGRGVAQLRRARVRVDVGCLEDACRKANQGFFSWIARGRPWVTLKSAATLDGHIADDDTPRGRIGWITGEQARQDAHRLRARHDAVLIGVGTMLADDPLLTVRLPRSSRVVERVVLDSDLATPSRARLLRQGTAGPRPIIITTTRAPERRARALVLAGADIVRLPTAARTRHPSIASVLKALADRGIQSVLIEGGARVHASFVHAGLVDGVAVYLAPKLLGGGTPMSDGPSAPLAGALPLGPLAIRRLGGDIVIEADVVVPPGARRRSKARRVHRHR